MWALPAPSPKEPFSLNVGTGFSAEQQSQDRGGTTHVGNPTPEPLAGRSIDHRHATLEIDPGESLSVLLSHHDDPQFLTAHQKVIVLADVAHLALVEVRGHAGTAIAVMPADETLGVDQIAANVFLEVPDPSGGAFWVRPDQVELQRQGCRSLTPNGVGEGDVGLCGIQA